jgi:peptidoglycan/xylan/chitin deacetylase (PgdA/CDA1 family)
MARGRGVPLAVAREGRSRPRPEGDVPTAMWRTSVNIRWPSGYVRPTRRRGTALARADLIRRLAHRARGVPTTPPVNAAPSVADALTARPLPRTPREVRRLYHLARVDPDARLIALTFDDGPFLKRTSQVLRVLGEHDVPATFFMIGRRAEAHPHLVRRVAAAGHTVASHAYLHRDLVRESTKRVERELRAAKATLEQITDREVSLFRPPHSSRDPRCWPQPTTSDSGSCTGRSASTTASAQRARSPRPSASDWPRTRSSCFTSCPRRSRHSRRSSRRRARPGTSSSGFRSDHPWETTSASARTPCAACGARRVITRLGRCSPPRRTHAGRCSSERTSDRPRRPPSRSQRRNGRSWLRRVPRRSPRRCRHISSDSSPTVRW